MNDNSDGTNSGHWGEEASKAFLDYGRYFVPDRELQFNIITELIPNKETEFTVLELCCGEGLLAELILDRCPTSLVSAYDGAPEMLERARERLGRFGERFQAALFELANTSWRKRDQPVQAVVSSLALHHLDGPGKQRLFRDVYSMLQPGGAFIIADIIAPAHPSGWDLAADHYDQAVRSRALELDGNEDGYVFLTAAVGIYFGISIPRILIFHLPSSTNSSGWKMPGLST